MCGLAGCLEPNSPPEPLLARARALSASLAHRGPDGAGEWGGAGIALAHRRLAILDPGEGGRQPMASRDGRWVLIHNGEIYNHLELRKDLPGSWVGTSDTETLLRGLEVHGLAFVERAAGMFAFAVWDTQQRELHLVRDRLGIKPLHFARRGSSFDFASEPGALAAQDDERRRLDREALASYLALGYPPPARTLFRGVESVLPGEIVSVGAAGTSRRLYWRLPERCEERSETEWQEAFDAAWRLATREHLLSDVPVGLFLSGGLDSGAVAAAVAGADIRVFAARFASPEYDESGEAQALAGRLGMSCTALPVDDSEVERVLPAVARHSDTPCSDSSLVGTWLLCREAARHVKVVLSGDGGDELLAGYPTHRATSLLLSRAGWLARIASAALGGWLPAPPPSRERVGAGQKLSRFLRYARHAPLGAHLRWRSMSPQHELALLFPDGPDPWPAWEALRDAHPGQPPLNRALALDVQGYLVQDELIRLDRMGMAHGLELRPPFLDHRLVELAFKMPPERKLRGGKGKLPVAAWLKARGLAELASRPKRGFNHPIARWLRGPLGDRLVAGLREAGLDRVLSVPTVERWLVGHRRGREDRAYELWNLLFLAEWARAHRIRAEG